MNLSRSAPPTLAVATLEIVAQPVESADGDDDADCHRRQARFRAHSYDDAVCAVNETA